MVITENGVAILKSPPSWLVWFVFFFVMCGQWILHVGKIHSVVSQYYLKYIHISFWTFEHPSVLGLVNLTFVILCSS